MTDKRVVLVIDDSGTVVRRAWSDAVVDGEKFVENVPYAEEGKNLEESRVAAEAAEAARQIEYMKAGFTACVQRHLDAAARARGYDNIFSAVTYADEPSVPSFQSEGLAFRAWRSLVWQHCYIVLGDVLAAKRELPTTDQLIAELPALVLPA